MTDTIPATALQLRSLVTAAGTLEISLDDVPVPTPAAGEVLVRVGAAPINPSDLGLLFAGTDIRKATVDGDGIARVVRAPIGAELLRSLQARVGDAMPAGNEGAGVVVATGASTAARALAGKTVALFGGAMYAQYRCVNATQCLVLPDGVTPRQGASCFVNPLTALGMTETMRLEGHTALVHTAAASNLGQMLNRICIADDIALVNVVRRPEQVELLRGLGATHVVDSSAPTFMDDLVAALTATGATLAFDAIGGGRLGGQILAAMESAANASAKEYNRYGSSVFKQLYIYGSLDRGPTELVRSFGYMWSVSGWLLMPFLQKIGPVATEELRQRVAREVLTTFASGYTSVISLADALRMDAIKSYARMQTGEKYLIDPTLP